MFTKQVSVSTLCIQLNLSQDESCIMLINIDKQGHNMKKKTARG